MSGLILFFARKKEMIARSLRWTAAILILTIFNWCTSRSVDGWPIIFGICVFFELMILVAQFIELTEDKPGQNNVR